MRRIGNAVYADDRSCVVRHARNGSDVVDLADNVRAMRKADKRGAIQKRRQRARIQMSGARVDTPLPDLHPGRLKPSPWTRVGLVILVGHDYGRAFGQPRTKRLRQNIGVLGR